ncbi:MAG: C10 family peptidase [Bacteroidales bacterium]|jgi:hypothetical protein|nr:C10 family peptidase [Bacteroidales bacterium]
MRKIYLLLMLTFFVTIAHATNVISPETAKTAAKNFMSERTGNETLALSDFTLTKTVKGNDGNALYYVFNMDNGGFVFISASDLLSPVLAFSVESPYKGNENSIYIEEKFKSQIQAVKAKPELADPKAAKAWKTYTNTNFKGGETKNATISPYVEPLVTTSWNQDKFYNQYCPYNADAGSTFDNRTPNGCVALTLSNLLNYYRYPSHGIGGVSYNAIDYNSDGTIKHHYGRLTELFTGLYDYNYITDDVSAYQGYLGKLTYHIGVSARMAYGVDGSGSNGTAALNALKTNWQYNENSSLRQKSAYTDSAWTNSVIIPELEKNCPVYYAGYSPTYGSGHAWIVDGYVTIDDSVQYFHVNWGWAGSDNGFYLITLLNTSAFGSFSHEESVIINIAPADSILAKPVTSFDTLYGKQGSICDGAGNQKYQPNSERKWLVSAPNATSYTFNFRKIKTQAGDEIIIYNGPTEASGVKVRYSGNYLNRACSDYSSGASSYRINFEGETMPGDVTVNASSVLVVFTSNADAATDYGFNINYKATISSDANSCRENYTPSSAEHAIISNKIDIAQGGNYHAHTDCGWRINCTNITGYTLNFRKFDLGHGDFVDLFDNSVSTKPKLLHRFDVNTLPTGTFNLNPTDGKLLIRFSSDNVDEGEGFELEYNAISLGVEDHNAFENINVYPNPATHYINVDCTIASEENLLLQLTDLTGRIVRSENVNHSGGTSTHNINVSDLANGIYMLRIQSAQGSVTKKVVIN